MNLSSRWQSLPATVVSSAVVLAACSSSSSSSQPPQTTAAKVDAARAEIDERLEQSAAIVPQFGERIPEAVAKGARCVIAVPSMIKGGLVVGAESGKGYVACQTAHGWSGPAPISMGGGTFGAQIGVQSTDLLALVMSPAGMNALLTGNVKIGVDASASAGPVGTGRGTGTDVPSKSDVVSYSRAKGLFAGAEMNGTTITFDAAATRVLYGSPVELSAILSGRVPPPEEPASAHFLSALRTGFGNGRAAQSPPPRS